VPAEKTVVFVSFNPNESSETEQYLADKIQVEKEKRQDFVVTATTFVPGVFAGLPGVLVNFEKK